MSLHDQIKLPPHVISSDHPNHPSERWSILEMAWIRHRDLAFTSHARHAAAEIAISSDARIQDLEDALQIALSAMESCNPGEWSTGYVIHASYDKNAIKVAIINATEVLKGQP